MTFIIINYKKNVLLLIVTLLLFNCSENQSVSNQSQEVIDKIDTLSLHASSVGSWIIPFNKKLFNGTVPLSNGIVIKKNDTIEQISFKIDFRNAIIRSSYQSKETNHFIKKIDSAFNLTIILQVAHDSLNQSVPHITTNIQNKDIQIEKYILINSSQHAFETAINLKWTTLKLDSIFSSKDSLLLKLFINPL